MNCGLQKTLWLISVNCFKDSKSVMVMKLDVIVVVQANICQ